MQVARRCDARTSLLLSLLVLLLGPPAAPGAWAADGLFSHLRETVRHSWQERTALLRANLDSLQPHSAAAHHYNIVGSSELDWVVFSGIGLEEGGPRHFDERDLKLVRRRRPHAAGHGETWLQALAWRKIVESQAAGASDIDTHGHSTALDVIHGAFRNGFSVVINMANHRLDALGSAALELSSWLGARVNANLYLTPGHTGGFEPHFDWMESIVVQLEGRKTWRIYEPLLHHPRPRQKFKPRASELGQPVQIVELRKGDVLYLPAGIPHECENAGDEPSLHVTFGVEIDEELTWVGALLTLWDVHVAATNLQSIPQQISTCDGKGVEASPGGCTLSLLSTAAVTAAVYAAGEHDPKLRRVALPIPRDFYQNETDDTRMFGSELLQMARAVLAYTDAAAQAHSLDGDAHPTAPDGWASIAALARSAAVKDVGSALQSKGSRLRLQGFVELDGDSVAETAFADGREKLERTAQRCAEDLRSRTAWRYRTLGDAQAFDSPLVESELRLALRRLGNISHGGISGEDEGMSDHQTAQTAVAALVSAASDSETTAHSFQALLASRNGLLRQAVEEQRESLQLHAAVRSDSDVVNAFEDYQERRRAGPVADPSIR
jgi:hypothetical protein